MVVLPSMEHKDLNMQPASMRKRIISNLIDALISLFASLILSSIVTGLFIQSSRLLYFNIFFIVFLTLFYFLNVIIYQISTGRSFGKYYCDLKICYPNQKVDIRNEDIIKREFSKLWTFATFGYSFFSQYEKTEIVAFHDEYSKTVILNLSEEHEAYLYEYHYEEYFHSEEEEQEYLKQKQEQKQIEFMNKEAERKEKEQLKQLKKEQKAIEYLNQESLNTQQMNNNQFVKNEFDNQSFPIDNENREVEQNYNFTQETPVVLAEQQYYQQSNMVNNVNIISEGVNIVGNTDFLPEESKNGAFAKLKNVFFKENSKNKSEFITNVDNKLSEFAQDNTFLPSENIFSQSYKGWALSNAQHEQSEKILN